MNSTIKSKSKPCKGTGKAKGYGCGEVVLDRRYGLGRCCYPKWLLETDEGKAIIARQALRGKKQIEKEKRHHVRMAKHNLETLAQAKSKLQSKINRLVRLIDHEKGCISCSHGHDGMFTRQKHASHFHSRGSNDSIRFHLDNIFTSCSICNGYQHGNLIGYKKGITERYGDEFLEYMTYEIPRKYPLMKFDKDQLREASKECNAIIKDILSGKDYTRTEINARLGLYY